MVGKVGQSEELMEAWARSGHPEVVSFSARSQA